MLGKYVPQDMEASAPRYIRIFGARVGEMGEIEGEGEREEESEKLRELPGFSCLCVQQGSAHSALLEMCVLWWEERWEREIWM